MDKPTKLPPVNAYAKDLVRLAEEHFAPGQEYPFSEGYNLLCDVAHELDLLYVKAANLEQRCQQLDAKLYAVALVLRP